MNLKERFLKYVSYDTQSSEESTTFPSTEKQKVLLAALRDEMEALGMTEVSMDQYGYVMGTVPATPGCENAPVIGFIAHVDTSPDMSGKDVKPRVIEEYDGCDIALNGQLTMRVADFPELEFFKGHTLIHTDGTTLLGSDDKSGITEIMGMLEYYAEHPELPHGDICAAFTPDEEIGRGTDCFDIERFGAKLAYTVDGADLGKISFENLNSAEAHIVVKGTSIHPGRGKNKLKNAVLMAIELQNMLPVAETPSHTEGYEGFYHLTEFHGDVERAEMIYKVSDFETEKFEARKERLRLACEYLNGVYDAGTFSISVKDTMRNMREAIEPHYELVENAMAAMRDVGVEPTLMPCRGGTDGVRLSFMGLPCPNLNTGSHNCHGRFECVPVESLEKITEMLIALVARYAEKI